MIVKHRGGLEDELDMELAFLVNACSADESDIVVMEFITLGSGYLSFGMDPHEMSGIMNAMNKGSKS